MSVVTLPRVHRSPIAAAPLPAFATRAARPMVDSFDRADGQFSQPDLRGVSVGRNYRHVLELQYTVRQGETLEAIARRLGTDVESLRYLNEELQSLRTGDKLTLPTTFHVVQRGESYWSVAQKTGIPYEQLMALNKAPQQAQLEIGQEIRVPAALLTPEHARLRDQLKAIVADGAAAYEAMYYGEGTTTAFNVGNELGYVAPNDAYDGFEFSDTYDQVKVRAGERSSPDAEPVPPTKLNDPVADTKRSVAAGALRRLTWLHFDQLQRSHPDTEILFPVDPVVQQDGRMHLRVYDAANAATVLTYDPRADLLTATSPDGSTWETSTARIATAVVELGKRLGTKLPAKVQI